MVEVSYSEASGRVVKVIGDIDEEIATEGIIHVDDSSDENFVINGHGELKSVFSVGVSLLDLIFVPLANFAAWIVVYHEVSTIFNMTGVLERSAELHGVSTGKKSKISVTKDVPLAASVDVDDVLPIIRRFSALDFSGHFESG